MSPPRSGAARGRTDQGPPRLYLVTPPLGATERFAKEVGAALDAGDVAAILLRLQPGDERTLINRIKTIGAVVQRRDVALLLDGHPDIVAGAGADGAHQTGIAALTAALAALQPDRIVGAGGLTSRHDAMLAGEAGADYVMFGEPPPPYPPPRAGEGRRPPLLALQKRLAWWAELFESPCIGYATSLDEIAPLAQAGADFVALGDWVWTHAQGPAAAVTMAAGHLGPHSSSRTLRA